MHIPRLRALRDQTERALEVLLGVPSYVCFGFELPREIRPGHYFAYTRFGMGAVVRQYIGRDRGPGPAVVVDERFLCEYAKAVARGRFAPPRLLAGQLFLGVVAHEYGHVLQTGWRHELALEELPAYIVGAESMAEAQLAQPPAPLTERPWPFAHHGAVFLRGVLHLHYRLRAALGIRFEPSFEADTYSMSSLWRYRSAIGDEPERMVDVPLQEIHGTLPPERFRELWKDDLRKWWLELSPPTEFQTTIMLRALEPFTLYT